jgi:branched-chain amino acid transport system ATP-binding protein
VHDLCAGYGGRQVLHGVSLEVYPHETVALIGLNGAGKTTLLRAVMGYVRPWSGLIRLGGRDLIGLRPHDIARLGVAYVPQDQTIFPDLSVREHLEVGATILPAAARRPRRDYVYHLFPRLHEREGQKANTLSGGERQMLSIARALMANPVMIMLDEPSLGLAPKVVDTIFGLLEEVHRSGTTILLVEQNAAGALAHSQRAYILETGASKHSGPCAELAARPDIRAAYLWGVE